VWQIPQHCSHPRLSFPIQLLQHLQNRDALLPAVIATSAEV
jgi:hypothetical protein